MKYDIDIETNFKKILFECFVDETELDDYLYDIENILTKSVIRYIILDDKDAKIFIEFNYISQSSLINININIPDTTSVEFIGSDIFKEKFKKIMISIVDDINTIFESTSIANVPNSYLRYIDNTFYVECNGHDSMVLSYNRLKAYPVESTTIDDVLNDIYEDQVSIKS